MFLQLLAHSPDLQRLVNEGYDVRLSASNNHLIVRSVPYVNSRAEVKEDGVLVMPIDTAGHRLCPPSSHVAYFCGAAPCDEHGAVIGAITNPEAPHERDKGLRVDLTLSGRPDVPYPDYYVKVTRYVSILGRPARALLPTVTARTSPPYSPEPDESVFNYIDTASSRAGIAALTARLELESVAIVGLGGTGSYVLDFIAKTPVKKIHIFDEDVLLTHNAFRSPGAPSLVELNDRPSPSKVLYYAQIYSRMHRGIVPHEHFIDEATVGDLDSMQFVFLCMDTTPAKRAIVDRLQSRGISFVEVGMGLRVGDDDKVAGVMRATTSTAQKSDHTARRIPFHDAAGDNEYDRNIQVAELNALNAALAVIRWKKLVGFYRDDGKEHSSNYAVHRTKHVNSDIA